MLDFLLQHARLFGVCIFSYFAPFTLDWTLSAPLFTMAKVSRTSPPTLNTALSVESSGAGVSKENGSGTKSKTLPSQFRASANSLHSLSSFSTRSESGGQDISPVLALAISKVGCV